MNEGHVRRPTTAAVRPVCFLGRRLCSHGRACCEQKQQRGEEWFSSHVQSFARLEGREADSVFGFDYCRNIAIRLIDPERAVAEVRKTSIVSLILTRASSSRIVDCLAQMYYVQFLAPY